MLTLEQINKCTDQSNGKVIVGRRGDDWCLFDTNYNVIGALGKYGWISKFWKGLARVTVLPDISEEEVRKQLDKYWASQNFKSKPNHAITTLKKCPLGIKKQYQKWGVINEKGVEVVPPIYDLVVDFYEKDNKSFTLKKDGKTFKADFDNPNVVYPCQLNAYNGNNGYSYYERDDWDGEEDEYAGTGADMAGFSADEIDAIFDGDPDAYWNID
ncbi:MAG: WG repeat-containing protein [Bacteroidales bacterium]|nr:WG repeat-containing protein [Bacteroidales bacterium]